MYNNSFGNPIDPYGQGSYVVTNTFGNPTDGLWRGGYGQNWGQAYNNAYTPNQFVQSGYVNAGRPGFMQSAANMAWGKDPYWGNPVDQIQPSVNSFASKPFDAAAWVAQNVAVPYAAYSGLNRMMGPIGASGIGGTLSAMKQGSGIASGLGRGIFAGAARGLGMGAGAAGMMGSLGGLAGGIALPLMAASYGADALNAGFIDPYKFGRSNANSLKESFSNVYFGAGGTPVTGKGLGAETAARMGNTVTQQGLQDRMFSRDEYSSLASMGLRSGLHDFAGQSKITESIKSVAELVKLTVSIMKDPDTKKAIEQLAQLQLAGADVSTFAGGRSSTAGRAISQLGMFAAQGGTSVQNLMNTVGAQGQALFQNSGMTPYLGQLAAANVYAGFAGAQRAGVISPQVMARMGGIQGATASALEAQMTGVQNPLGTMSSYNRFISGIQGGPGLNSMVGAFGQGVSSNPLKAMGSMGLYGGAMAGADLSSRGILNVENQLLNFAKSTGTGTSVEELYALGQSVGYSPQQLQAYFNLRAAQQTPGAARQGYAAIQGQSAEQVRAYANQIGVGSAIGRNITRPLGSAMRGIGRLMAKPGEYLNEMQGSAEDTLAGMNDWWSFSGVGKATYVTDVDNLFGEKTSNLGFFRGTDSANLSNLSLKKNPLLDKRLVAIDRLAKAGDEHAIAYLKASNSDERDKALSKLVSSGVLGEGGSELDYNKVSLYEASRARSSLEKEAASAERVQNATGNNALTKAMDTSIIQSIGTAYHENYNDKDLSLSERAKYHYMIGGASELSEQLRNGSISESELLNLVKTDGRFAGILSRAKQVAGEDASEEDLNGVIMDQVGGLRRGGVLSGASAMSKEVFKNIKDYGSIGDMSDESIKSAYKKAAKGTGGVLVAEHFKSGGGFFGGGMTEEEITGLEEIGKTTSGAMKLATEAFQKSSVDYATYSETLKKIGVSESDRFGAYVDNFGRKIDEMNGKKPSADKYIMNNEATKQQAEWMNKVAGNNAPDTNQKTDTGIGASVGNALRDAWKRNFL